MKLKSYSNWRKSGNAIFPNMANFDGSKTVQVQNTFFSLNSFLLDTKLYMLE